MLPDNTLKTCTGCHEPKPLTAFYTHPGTKDGLRPKCKLCIVEETQAFRRNHLEAYRAYTAAYNEAHREDRRSYYLANRERIRTRTAAYQSQHPEFGQAHKHARRARVRGVPAETVHVLALFKRDRGVCGICGLKVTWRPRDRMMRPSHDHIIPVSKGGENTYANARLAHLRCNISRGNRGSAQLRML